MKAARLLDCYRPAGCGSRQLDLHRRIRQQRLVRATAGLLSVEFADDGGPYQDALVIAWAEL